MLFAYKRQTFLSSVNDCCSNFHYYSLLLDSSSHFHMRCSFYLDSHLLFLSNRLHFTFLSVKVTIVVPFHSIMFVVPYDQITIAVSFHQNNSLFPFQQLNSQLIVNYASLYSNSIISFQLNEFSRLASSFSFTTCQKLDFNYVK